MDRGAWRATVQGVAKSRIWLSNLHTHIWWSGERNQNYLQREWLVSQTWPKKKKKRKRRSVSWNNQSCTWTQPFATRSCSKTERRLSPEATDSAMEIPAPISGWGEGVSSAGGQQQSWPQQGLERSSTRSNMAHTVACGGQQWHNCQGAQ